MTILDDPPAPPSVGPSPAPASAQVPAPVDGPRPASASGAASGSESLIRAVLVMLAVTVAVVALWKAFDQVIAPAWFRNRQSNLAADFAVPRSSSKPGQSLAVLQIPGIGANLVVIEGSNPNELRGAPGHRAGTPDPGDVGNSIIEGHRERWGGPFGDLDKLVPRTRVVTVTRSGIPTEFRVTKVKRVKRADLAPWLASSRDRRITLVTHAGGSFSEDRLVVQAVAGKVSKQPGKAESPPADPPAGSLLSSLFAFLLCVGAGALAWTRLRVEHGRLSLAMVLTPLAIGALLALLLTADTVLSSLL